MTKPIRILLFVLLLAAMVVAGGFYYLSRYEPPEYRGNAVLSMSIGTFHLGKIEMVDITIEGAIPPYVESYPDSWESLLEQEFKTVTMAQALLPFDGWEIVANDIALKFNSKHEVEKWQGSWTLNQATFTGAPYPVPPISGKGVFTANAKSISFTGRMQDEKDTSHVGFVAHLAVNKPESAWMDFTSGAMPFEGGMVKLQSGKLSFQGKERFNGVLKAENIPLAKLLDMFWEGKISATGNVSGAIPLVIDENGVPVIKDAVLAAGQAGTIALQPDALPAGNKQLALVENVLKNFHYTDLGLKLASNNKKELNATLTIEGKNPDMYNGRPIKLNVHLTGDLLSLIQSSMTLLSDPASILKKGTQ